MKYLNVHLTYRLKEIIVAQCKNEILKNILDIFAKNKIMIAELLIKSQNGYTFIELFGNFLVCFMLYYISYIRKISVIAGSCLALNNLLGKAWWLFHMFNSKVFIIC